MRWKWKSRLPAFLVMFAGSFNPPVIVSRLWLDMIFRNVARPNKGRCLQQKLMQLPDVHEFVAAL